MPGTLQQGHAGPALAQDGAPAGVRTGRWPDTKRWRGRISQAGTLLLATCVATVTLTGLTVGRASAALPGLTTPGRVYPAVNTMFSFSGTDAVSGDNLAIQVSGLTETNNCDPTAGNNYAITGCPRIQMSLSTAKAGLLRIPDTTAITNLDASPDVDVLVNSTGVVITEATDSHGLDSTTFNFNGHPADIAATLAKLQFVPCQSQMGTTKVPAAPAGESPVEVDCGVTGGFPVDEPAYEEKESADSSLPTLTVVAIQGATAENFTRQIKIKVEGSNASPTVTVPVSAINVPLSTTTDVDGVVDVIDPEMCDLTICGNPYTNPGDKEGDDQMLLLAWIPENNCGTFSFRGGAFTSLGSGTDNSVHKVLRSQTGLTLSDAEQSAAADAIAAAVESGLSVDALALDLSTQPSSATSATKVFAGVAKLAEIKYALSQIDYNSPSADATCHLNVAVSDLGNNGRPVTYVGSPFGPETPYPGHATDDVPYEVPDAKSDAKSMQFIVSDGHPNVTVSQTLSGALGDPAGPNKASGFTITFSEPIDPASFTPSDLSLSTSSATGPGLGVLVPVVPGLVYTVPVTATGDGKITLTMNAGAAYSAGHNGEAAHTSEAPTYSDNSIDWDQTAPKVTINQKVAQADPTTASPVVFTVVFDETSVTTPAEFTASDISFSGSTAAGTLVATVTQPSLADFSTYEVSVSGMTSSGTVVASVKANAITDLALNGSAASTSTDNTIQYNKPIVDNTPPDVTIDQAAGQTDPTTTTPITYTVVFTEPVTGFTTGDITLGGTAGATTATITGNGANYTVTVTGMTQTGTVTATIATGKATDAANNPNNASTSTDNTIQYNQPIVDNTPPDVTIDQAAGQTDPTTTTPITYTVVFTEPVTGFTTGDITLGGTAGATTATITGNGANYTVTVTGMTQTGTVTATIATGKATDAANNPNNASTSTDNTIQYNQPIVDNTPPDVTIDQAAGQTDPTTTTPITYTVVFTEPVTGFTTGDITLGGTAGATTATITGNGANYTVTVTGMTQTGTVTATIATGKATDAANNPNNASTSTDNTIQYNQPAAQPIVVQSSGGAVTIAASGGQLVSASSAAPVVQPPSGYTLPVGQLSFTANTPAGGLVTFTITLPVTVTDYMKLIGGQWQAFPWDGETGAQINGNTIMVTIRDNGRGDSDPTAGVATDPGIPVNAVPANPAPANPAPANPAPVPVPPATGAPVPVPPATGAPATVAPATAAPTTVASATSAGASSTTAGSAATTVAPAPAQSGAAVTTVTLPQTAPVDASALPTAPVAAPAESGDSVAFTGSQSTDLALFALILLTLGLGFVVVARRRALRPGNTN